MEFTQKKLDKSVISKLHKVEMDSVKPYHLMLAPVYLHLKVNQKFIAIKSPLDFFTETELERLKPFKSLYLSEFMSSLIPYREVGEEVREILQRKSVSSIEFEVSATVIRSLAKIWTKYPTRGVGVEPFLLAVFVNEVCGEYPREQLMHAREKSTSILDRAILRSSWAVFLALHLGYYDLNFLIHFRNQVFECELSQKAMSPSRNELDELIALAFNTFNHDELRILQGDFFQYREERVAHKLQSRLRKMEKDFNEPLGNPISIYGKKGFIDA